MLTDAKIIHDLRYESREILKIGTRNGKRADSWKSQRDSFQPLKDEEIVFGTVFSDGHFSNLFSVNPTAGQLQRLWSLHDNIFSHCFCEDCGHKSYAFSDRMREDPLNPGHVAYHETVFFCPNCGARKGYGGSFFRSRAIQAVIRQDLGEVRD